MGKELILEESIKMIFASDPASRGCDIIAQDVWQANGFPSDRTFQGILFIDRMTKEDKAELKSELDKLQSETKAGLKPK